MSAVQGVGGAAPGAAAGAAAGDARPDREDRLQRAAHQMEGVFLAQLFKAMRETVPEGSMGRGGAGEQMFTALMDERLAETATTGWDRGVGAALYRQLRARIAPPQTQGEAESV